MFRCHLIEIPIFTSEMVQPMIRPAIQSGSLICITFGFSLTYITSAVTYWRMVMYTNTLFCAVALLAQAFVLVESHVWLMEHGRTEDAERLLTKASFIFGRTFFVQKGKMFTFSRAQSHALTNATRCHEYSLRLSRLLPVPEIYGAKFLQLRFRGKMAF